MILVAGFLSAIVLWVLGGIINSFEQRRWDREFYERWGEERRPKGAPSNRHPGALVCVRCHAEQEPSWTTHCQACGVSYAAWPPR